jgi:phosphorylcholine metabolism protein LicD
MAKSIIIIVIIFLIYSYTILIRQEKFVNVSTNELTPYKNLQDTVNILKRVTTILKANNIDYWVIHTTLLGTVRNKHILTWVDDADISIQYNDLPKLLKLEKELNKNNIGIIKQDDRYKLHQLNSIYPFVDVFPVISSDNKYIYENPIARENLSKEYFYKDELFPLKEYMFEDFIVYGPNVPTRYLETNFRNWKNKGYKTGWINSTQTFMQPITFDLKYSSKPYLWLNNSVEATSYKKYKNEFNIIIVNNKMHPIELLYKYGGIYINDNSYYDLYDIMNNLKKYDFVSMNNMIASRANTRLLGLVLERLNSVQNDNSTLSETINKLVINENYLAFPSNNK